MAQKEINCNESIDNAFAIKVAHTILELAGKISIEESISFMNGVTVALASIVADVKNVVVESKEDGLERLILSWLCTTDLVTGNNFSNYIDIKDERKDNNLLA